MDGNITLNSTVVDDQKQEMPPKPELPEKEVDFRILFKDNKTEHKVTNELEKYLGSHLNIAIGFGVIQLEATYFINKVQLDESESMRHLLNSVTWPGKCRLVTTHLKKRLH